MKALIILGSLPGALAIILGIITKVVYHSYDSNLIEIIIANSALIPTEAIGKELQLMIILVKLEQYSTLIIAVGLIWLIGFAYLWERRVNNEK